jgi:hypothetical protein
MELVVIIVWIVLKSVPHFVEQGWGGAVDLLLLIACNRGDIELANFL